MGKKIVQSAKTPETAQDPGIRHARIELSDEDYERLRKVSRINGLSISAYIRQAVLKQIRRDESEVGA
jgi:hypothetical protein